ncbi:hypothetical protein TWF281_003457 [Arthrobotrys megalospora]
MALPTNPPRSPSPVYLACTPGACDVNMDPILESQNGNPTETMEQDDVLEPTEDEYTYISKPERNTTDWQWWAIFLPALVASTAISLIFYYRKYYYQHQYAYTNYYGDVDVRNANVNCNYTYTDRNCLLASTVQELDGNTMVSIEDVMIIENRSTRPKSLGLEFDCYSSNTKYQPLRLEVLRQPTDVYLRIRSTYINMDTPLEPRDNNYKPTETEKGRCTALNPIKIEQRGYGPQHLAHDRPRITEWRWWAVFFPTFIVFIIITLIFLAMGDLWYCGLGLVAAILVLLNQGYDHSGIYALAVVAYGIAVITPLPDLPATATSTGGRSKTVTETVTVWG